MAVQVIAMGVVVAMPMVCVIVVMMPVGAVIMWHWTSAFLRTLHAGSKPAYR